ncbi:unnamed protein product [Amoebophrya sp. A25]|nr:unnamed protein product [Amoebophrya sp. A25]|eukprot:GSA25T00003134001.1
MAEPSSGTGSRDTSKDRTEGGGRGDSKQRRSSLAKDLGQSLQDLAQQREFTKPAFLQDVLNPVLEAMALQYFEKDEMEQLSTSYEDTVKQYIKWVQESQNLSPPPEYDAPDPSREELQRLRDGIKELQRKLQDIEKIEEASTKPGVDKLKQGVRRLSTTRRLSKAIGGASGGGGGGS